MDEILEDNVPQVINKDFTLADGSKYFALSRSTVEHIFEMHYRLNSSEFEGLTLRSLLYDRVQEEMPAVEQAFREKYGVKQN